MVRFQLLILGLCLAFAASLPTGYRDTDKLISNIAKDKRLVDLLQRVLNTKRKQETQAQETQSQGTGTADSDASQSFNDTGSNNGGQSDTSHTDGQGDTSNADGQGDTSHIGGQGDTSNPDGQGGTSASGNAAENSNEIAQTMEFEHYLMMLALHQICYSNHALFPNELLPICDINNTPETEPTPEDMATFIEHLVPYGLCTTVTALAKLREHARDQAGWDNSWEGETVLAGSEVFMKFWCSVEYPGEEAFQTKK